MGSQFSNFENNSLTNFSIIELNENFKSVKDSFENIRLDFSELSSADNSFIGMLTAQDSASLALNSLGSGLDKINSFFDTVLQSTSNLFSPLKDIKYEDLNLQEKSINTEISANIPESKNYQIDNISAEIPDTPYEKYLEVDRKKLNILKSSVVNYQISEIKKEFPIKERPKILPIEVEFPTNLYSKNFLNQLKNYKIKNTINYKISFNTTEEDEEISYEEKINKAISQQNFDFLKKKELHPDFMGNTFDIFFEIYLKGNRKDFLNNLGFEELVARKDNRPILLSSRIQSIEIPGISKSTIDRKFCGTQVTLPDNQFSDPHMSSFSIRADQELFWIDLLSQFSNTDVSLHHEWAESSISALKKPGETLKISFDEIPYINIGTIEDKVNKPFEGKFSIILRKVVNLATPENLIHERLLPKIYTNKLFRFDDVKLLGTSTNIDFSNSNADPKVFTFNFIYRDAYQLVLDEEN